MSHFLAYFIKVHTRKSCLPHAETLFRYILSVAVSFSILGSNFFVVAMSAATADAPHSLYLKISSAPNPTPSLQSTIEQHFRVPNLAPSSLIAPLNI